MNGKKIGIVFSAFVLIIVVFALGIFVGIKYESRKHNNEKVVDKKDNDIENINSVKENIKYISFNS